MAKKRVGPLSKDIKKLCFGWRSKRMDDSAFKEKLRETIAKFSHMRNLHQDIGMAVQRWYCSHPKPFDPQAQGYVWRLVDEVDPKIRISYEKWKKAMFE